MGFFQNTRKPDGLGGKLMVKMMNSGHSALAQWGFSHAAAQDGAEILDAGCGGGANVAAWLEKCPHSCVAGLDYSEVSVAETKQVNAAAIQAGWCTVVQGDVSQMPFPDSRFDFVSAFETIYFWPGLEACFAEVCRVLRPGGTFLICNELDGTDDHWTKVVEGMRVYTTEQICAALKQAGFSEPECREEGKKHWICILARKN